MDTDGFIFPSEIDDNDGQSSSSDMMETTDNAYATNEEAGVNGTDRNNTLNGVQCIPLESCGEELQNVVKRYKHVKEELKKRDILASQLATGIYLQKEMDKCISCQQSFPVRLHFEVHKLSSGSSILTVHVQNTGEFTLLDWSLVFTIQLLAENDDSDTDTFKTFTKSVHMKRLSKELNFSSEILCTGTNRMSWLIRTQLLKAFPLHSETRIFRLELNAYYYSLWNELKRLKAIDGDGMDSDSSRDVSELRNDGKTVSYKLNSQSDVIQLPEAVVFLICQQTLSPESLIQWIFFGKLAPPSNTVQCHCNYKNSMHYVTVTISKGFKRYDVTVATNNRELRQHLIQQLQIRLLIHLRYSRSKSLKKNADCELLSSSDSNSSLSVYFDDYLSRFM